MKKISIIILSILILFTSVGAAYAAPIDVSAVNEDNKSFVISGCIESETLPVRVLIQVLNPKYTDIDLKEADLSDVGNIFAYVGQCETDSLGRYSFVFEPAENKSGRYSVRVSWNTNEQEPVYSQNCIVYVSDNLTDEFLANINSFETREETESYITENIGLFDVCSDDYLSMSPSDRAEVAETVLNNKTFSDVEEILQCFSVAVLSELLEKCDSSDEALELVKKYKTDAYLIEQTEYNLFDEFLSDEAKLIVAQKLSDESPYDSADSLGYTFSEAVVLTSINTCSNYSGITRILTDTKDFTKIDLSDYNSIKNKKSVNEALMHKDIQSIDELDKLLKKAVKDALGSKKNPSTGSGSGGGMSASYPTVPSNVNESESEDETPVTEHSKVSEFADMSGYEWAENAVYSLVNKGIVNGVGKNEFAPAKNITRAEFTKLIFALTDDANVTNKASSIFEDLDNNSWYASYVYEASKRGIVNGSGGLFRPDDFITRQDAAVIVYRTLSSQKSFVNKTDFADSSEISEYARDAAAYLGGCGIISGMGGGVFSPQSMLTRAQAAVLINSALEYKLK